MKTKRGCLKSNFKIVIQSETKNLGCLKIKILNIDEILHFAQNDTFQTASYYMNFNIYSANTTIKASSVLVTLVKPCLAKPFIPLSQALLLKPACAFRSFKDMLF